METLTPPTVNIVIVTHPVDPGLKYAARRMTLRKLHVEWVTGVYILPTVKCRNLKMIGLECQ